MSVDLYDVLTTTEAKQILSVALTDSSKDSTIERLVTTVSRRLDTLVGPVVQRSVTSEAHDGGCTSIHLEMYPVSAVASVSEYRGTSGYAVTAETAGTQPTSGFYAERYKANRSLMSGVLVRRVSGSTDAWYPGFGNVLVTYTAGHAASTTTVDPRHKEAAELMLRNLWRSYENTVGGVDQYDVPIQSFPTFAVPKAVRDLLAEEIQDSVGFG